MPGLTRAAIDRISRVVKDAERERPELDDERRKYPVGGGGKRLQVFRLTGGRLYYGLEVQGTKQQWTDADAFENAAGSPTPTGQIRCELSRDYYFEGMAVAVQKFGDIYQVISPGFSSIRCVLDGNLASSSTATASVWEQDELGAWADTLDNITVRPWSTTLNATITAGTKVLCTQLGPGVWNATIEECAS